MLPDVANEDGVHGQPPPHLRVGHGGLYLPVSQLVHVLDAIAEYLPPSQAVHSTEPIESLYCPATHTVHVPPFSPVYPALHWHLITSSLALGEIEFEGQSLQVLSTEAPRIVEYLPATQSMQVLDAISEYSPAAQSMQVVDVLAPRIVEYLPATQPMHVPGPVNGL
jgi:hypothetical protein